MTTFTYNFLLLSMSLTLLSVTALACLVIYKALRGDL